MSVERLFFALIFLFGFWLFIILVGAIFAVRYASIDAQRKILAISDNWLLRPLYTFVGWAVEGGRNPDRDG
ncbi:MAG: hypothetical protein JWM07_131 [Candidatus Saccharibacteria bacterium]|nr:hypothetical protein [Candidatus Saccharibacteria bacterium]